MIYPANLSVYPQVSALGALCLYAASIFEELFYANSYAQALRILKYEYGIDLKKSKLVLLREFSDNPLKDMSIEGEIHRCGYLKTMTARIMSSFYRVLYKLQSTFIFLVSLILLCTL